jgi:hypothetical protein
LEKIAQNLAQLFFEKTLTMEKVAHKGELLL